MPDQTPWIKLSSPQYVKGAQDALLETLQPGILDPEAEQFSAEHRLAAFLGVDPRHVLLTNSCTAALATAYHFLAGTPPRPIEAPVLTWPATYAYAPHKNLVDTDTNGWPCWSDRDDVVRLVVALWGRTVPPEVLEEARGAGCPVILDSAHAMGRGLDHLAAGLVDAVAYSFGPTKEVPCVRGGAVVSPHITDDWRAFRDSGTLGRYGIYPSGFNFEIPEPFAALLFHQLNFVGEWYNRRQVLLRRYAFFLDPLLDISLHTRPDLNNPSGHLCVIQARDDTQRDLYAARLYDRQIQSGVHYHIPAWISPASVPQAWFLSRTVLSLPCHCNMTTSDVDRVVEALRGV